MWSIEMILSFKWAISDVIGVAGHTSSAALRRRRFYSVFVVFISPFALKCRLPADDITGGIITGSRRYFFKIYLSLASDDTWHPAEKMRTFGRHIFRPLFALQVWHNSRTQFYGEERRGNEIILSETADWLIPRLKCHWNCLRFHSFLWLVGEGRAKIRVTLILFID